MGLTPTSPLTFLYPGLLTNKSLIIRVALKSVGKCFWGVFIIQYVMCYKTNVFKPDIPVHIHLY